MVPPRGRVEGGGPEGIILAVIHDLSGLRGPVLVTGATGFIGRRIVERLLAGGAAVSAFVLPGESVPVGWGAGGEVVRGDVADAPAVDRAMEGIGTVVHLAAVVGDWAPASLFDRVTVRGTRHVLSAAAAARARAVLASSVVVYGDSIGRDVCDEDHPFGRPLGLYGRSKQAQELCARELAASRGLEVVIVRPTNVFGPGSRPWVDEVLAQIRRGLPTLVGGGAGRAGLCSVENAVDVFLRAAATPSAAGRIYNASDGSEVTWRRYFEDLARAAGAPPPKAVPELVARASARVCEAVWRLGRLAGRPPITREALNLIGSDFQVPIERARRELGYSPDPASYESTMAALRALPWT